MFQKKYVEKAKQTILNRVKFHAPIVFDDKLNYKNLNKYHIDMNLPIFKFEKKLNNLLLRAFEQAFCEENFNLLIFNNGDMQKKVLRKIPNAVFLDNDCDGEVLEYVNKLNINYASSSNYNLVFKDRFFRVNKQILNPHFEEFSLHTVQSLDNLFVEYNEFVLNGSNFFCQIKNRCQNEVRAEIELNIPLQKGYYYFKKSPHTILIENLLSKEKMFLNFVCRNAKFRFSDVDGLENSAFSCVNVKASIKILPEEETYVFFNFGYDRFVPKTLKHVEMMKNLAWKKCCEIFNLQVKTKNPKFDYFFNKTLPQRIWLNWLNGQVDDALEQKYLTYKRLFLKGELRYGKKLAARANFDGKGNVGKRTGFSGHILPSNPCKEVTQNEKGLTLVNFAKIGLRELGIFNGDYYKRIFIVKGDEKFLKVGRTFFYNISGITEHSLTSIEPISVCFGDGTNRSL